MIAKFSKSKKNKTILLLFFSFQITVCLAQYESEDYKILDKLLRAYPNMNLQPERVFEGNIGAYLTFFEIYLYGEGSNAVDTVASFVNFRKELPEKTYKTHFIAPNEWGVESPWDLEKLRKLIAPDSSQRKVYVASPIYSLDKNMAIVPCYNLSKDWVTFTLFKRKDEWELVAMVDVFPIIDLRKSVH